VNVKTLPELNAPSSSMEALDGNLVERIGNVLVIVDDDIELVEVTTAISVAEDVDSFVDNAG
jgi:hypothetical protein